MKYNIYARITAGKYLGEIEADSEGAAIDKAYEKFSDSMYISLCHQCSDEMDDPEVDEIIAEEIK
mgnify:CR=1 FL=1